MATPSDTDADLASTATPSPRKNPGSGLAASVLPFPDLPPEQRIARLRELIFRTGAHGAALEEILRSLVQGEERIVRLTNLCQARSEINQIIVRLHTPAELFSVVCRIAVEYGGMELAWIGTGNPATGRIDPVAHYGEAIAYLDGITVSSTADTPEGCGPTGWAYRTDRFHTVQDCVTDPMVAPWRERALCHGLHSAAAFPIRRNEAPHAVLTVYSAQADAFDDEVVALLQEISRDLSFALDAINNAHARREVVAALRRSERDLREKNEFLNSILQSEPECVLVLDADCALQSINQAGLRMLGVDAEDEVASPGLLEFIRPDDRDAFLELHRRVCGGESGVLEIAIRARDGTARWLEIHAACLHDVGNDVVNEIGNEINNEISNGISTKTPGFLGIARDISDSKRSAELIWRQANFDFLTGLPNRYMLRDRLQQEIKKSHRTGSLIALLFIDLDRFKEINDTLGHDRGDRLLVETARRIVACVRESDTVARIGGDEFTVILPQLGHPGDAEAIAGNIITRIAEAYTLGTESAFVTASVGITYSPTDTQDADTLIGNADQAMYVAKRHGRNRLAYFTAALQAEAKARLHRINDLRHALPNGELQVFFQPIIDLSDGRICGAEALLRWLHPTEGWISPDEFIPIAEETALIVDIGDWVFRESVRWARRWHEQGIGDGFCVHVNASPVQFRDSACIRTWPQHLQEQQLPAGSIAIEITEGLLLEADAAVTELLIRLRDGGFAIALDDFGTGYSSLAYLHKFQIDHLKIDQSFTRNLETEPAARTLSKTIVRMAQELGLRVIAEGVETAAQEEFLKSVGCSHAQGFRFSKPVPAQTFETLLHADGISAGESPAGESAAVESPALESPR